MAGPGGPVQSPEIGDDLGPEGVQVEVADQFQEVRLLFDHDGLVPILEEVAHAVVPAVEGPSVPREERPHHAAQGAVARPD